ncbi:glycosyltransferase family 2 protein [Crassaminicella indica]|uniref:Glycosyltransferase n=1 Tax=Crassaminicella indica TaxID=2855394 RepID=A0ABX8RCA9_9CLOT|nr:glycosyltransferase family A protein [Crassaminicella indica]QXM06683.1 glycosyltransferase [Crassaminicella indica]
MIKPLISVIIPMYNCEKYIEECIKSLSTQSIAKQIEIIIVDDGSEDKSAIVAQESLHYFNLKGKVIRQVNKGVSAARNIGIDEANGEFLMFIDADDTLIKDALKSLYDKAIKKKSKLVYGGYRNVTSKNKEIWNYTNTYKYFSGSGSDTTLLFLQRKIWIRIGTFIVCKELVITNKIRFSVGCKYGEDQEFTIKCLLASEKVETISQTIYNYRQHDDSAMRKRNFEQFDYVDAMIRIYRYLEDNNYSNDELKETIVHYVLPNAIMSVIYCLAYSGVKHKELVTFIEKKEYDKFLKVPLNDIAIGYGIDKEIMLWRKYPIYYCYKAHLRFFIKSFIVKATKLFVFK